MKRWAVPTLLFDVDTLAVDGIGTDPAVDAAAVIPDLKSLALNGFDQMNIRRRLTHSILLISKNSGLSRTQALVFLIFHDTTDFHSNHRQH